MTVHPLLLERLEPGTRVRADGDVIYVTHDLEIVDGTEGTIVQSWGVGLSWVRWDLALDEVVATSHDSLALVVDRGVVLRRCPQCHAVPELAANLPFIACLGCGWRRRSSPVECLKRREGWKSPIATGCGFVSFDPCPECGTIHR
jgi:hypothetical protein